MSIRSISVLDRSSGRLSVKVSSTPTLDVPADFDRTACEAVGDAHARVHYLSMSGSRLVSSAHPRPLSWRVQGEECLVAFGTRGDEIPYRLCIADPLPE